MVNPNRSPFYKVWQYFEVPLQEFFTYWTTLSRKEKEEHLKFGEML